MPTTTATTMLPGNTGPAAIPSPRRLSRVLGVALAAALVAALASAWFAVGAGVDDPEPVATWGGD